MTTSSAAQILTQEMEPIAPLRQVDEGLYTALPPEQAPAHYDRRVALYDLVIGSRLYSWVAWGVAASRFPAFIDRALASRPGGWVLDVAAGSCLESAKPYTRCTRNIVVVDRSLQMLERGLRRLRSVAGALPSNVVFLQADAYALPFADGFFTTVLSHGAFHVFDPAPPVCKEWARVLHPAGSLFVSSLVSGRAIGDAYLRVLQRAGEIGPPSSPETLAAMFQGEFARTLSLDVHGNFAFLASEPEAASEAAASEAAGAP